MTNEHAQSPNTKWFVKDVLVQLGCEHKSGTAVWWQPATPGLRWVRSTERKIKPSPTPYPRAPSLGKDDKVVFFLLRKDILSAESDLRSGISIRKIHPRSSTRLDPMGCLFGSDLHPRTSQLRGSSWKRNSCHLPSFFVTRWGSLQEPWEWHCRERSLYCTGLRRTKTTWLLPPLSSGSVGPYANQPDNLLFLNKSHVKKADLQKMLGQGIIEPCQSSWASPVILVTKNDGSNWFCMDYWKINKVPIQYYG